MAKYVPDIGSRRWVIISPGRTSRPNQCASHAGVHDAVGTKACPFCVGNEALTPPEVYRIGTGEKDKPGWDVRVVPNKFPITDMHEVIIHSTDNEKDIEDLPVGQITKILTAYRDRYRAHDNDGQVLIFCNHGVAAGASLKHPHSQLVVVPRQINLDAVIREPVANVVDEGDTFITYCPDFSQWPFEVWIAPNPPAGGEDGKFSSVGDNQIVELAPVLKSALQRIRGAQNKEPFVYNYYIYHGENWFIRITPRFVHRAGFELGTGLNVNITDPTEAARILKEVTV